MVRKLQSMKQRNEEVKQKV
jgi:predicted nuclease with TOPRIM domain